MLNPKSEPAAKSGKRVLIGQHLFTLPGTLSEEPRLIGSKCNNCGEVVFPAQTGCPNCCSEGMTEILMGPRGKLFSFSNVCMPVPTGYRGPVPYGVGLVDLPEGARVVAHLTESDPAKLKIGMDMVLVIGRLFDDEEGNEVIGFEFKPL